MPPDNLKIALAGCYTDAHLAGIYRLELAPETGECRAVPLELPLENLKKRLDAVMKEFFSE